MHGMPRSKGRAALAHAEPHLNAVVWLEPGRALVVRGGDGADLPAMELPIPSMPAATPPALAEIAHSIGKVDRVLVLGTDELRIALEREIVAIGHRPETIRDADVAEPMDEAALRERLASLG
jgi:hypothetical protein